MKYVINDFLYYDVINATLSIDDDGISDTHLSITANALLYYLLQNEGVISRDDIMKSVWDDNGLTSSNGNLNQYLSLLRKCFRNYQIDNFIITVARGRLEINKDISVEIVDDNKLHPLLLEQEDIIEKQTEENKEPSIYNDNQATTDPVSPQAKETQNRNWMIASIALFSAALVLLWVTIVSDRTTDFFELNEVSSDACELFSSEKMINHEMDESYLTSFESVRDKLGLKCSDKRRFVFYYSDKFKNKGLGRTFLAQCAKNKNNPYAYCDNYFYYSWK